MTTHIIGTPYPASYTPPVPTVYIARRRTALGVATTAMLLLATLTAMYLAYQGSTAAAYSILFLAGATGGTAEFTRTSYRKARR